MLNPLLTSWSSAEPPRLGVWEVRVPGLTETSRRWYSLFDLVWMFPAAEVDTAAAETRVAARQDYEYRGLAVDPAENARIK